MRWPLPVSCGVYFTPSSIHKASRIPATIQTPFIRNKEFWRLPFGPFYHDKIDQGGNVGIPTIFKNIYSKYTTLNGFTAEFFLKSTLSSLYSRNSLFMK